MVVIIAIAVFTVAGTAFLQSNLGRVTRNELYDEVEIVAEALNTTEDDIAMLERFEHAYATKGASEAAKRAAGTVIGSCAFHAVPRHMLKTLKDQRAYTQVG